MADFIKIKINNKEIASIKAGAKELANLRKPMSQFLAFLELETKQQFVSQTDPDGKRWKDLSPRTWARKKSNTILRETGVMINTIYTKTNDLGGEIGLTSEIATYHQLGTKRMPQRTILGVTEARLAKGAAIFELYVGDVLGAS